VAPMNAEESTRYDETVRLMIHRENEVIHHRVTWLTTIQGLLFAGLGLAWGKQESRPLVAIFCGMGVLISVVSLAALSGASLATVRLIRWWENNKPPHYSGPDVIGIRPTFGIGPWSLIPVIFLVAWGAVWLLRY
jgi:hypothetical protein